MNLSVERMSRIGSLLVFVLNMQLIFSDAACTLGHFLKTRRRVARFKLLRLLVTFALMPVYAGNLIDGRLTCLIEYIFRVYIASSQRVGIIRDSYANPNI